MTDTIFALSSGPPPAAIAVLRISGPQALAAVAALAGRVPPPRAAALRTLRDPGDGTTLDHALVLTFPGPASATGEDVAELHLHGGRAVIRAVERVLATLPGLRYAEAGEFTRRALLAGRIDLTEAEGLADLLAAETERQRRAAIHNAEGRLRRRIEDWANRTLQLAAAIEAAIDHGDEDDLRDERAIVAFVQDGARALADEIATLIVQPPVERLRDGIRVVLAGPPNSGKSTLINMMAERDVAIVSPMAGTTRDRIEAPVTRDGIAWVLTDTAGLAEASDDPIERIGIDRARDSAASADILLWLGDDAPTRGDALLLHARADIVGREIVPEGRIAVSRNQPASVVGLWDALKGRARLLLPSEDQPTINDRQRSLCASANQALCSAAQTSDPLLFAEEIRLAMQQFQHLTGKADIEALLDTLFARFCIGK